MRMQIYVEFPEAKKLAPLKAASLFNQIKGQWEVLASHGQNHYQHEISHGRHSIRWLTAGGNELTVIYQGESGLTLLYEGRRCALGDPGNGVGRALEILNLLDPQVREKAVVVSYESSRDDAPWWRAGLAATKEEQEELDREAAIAEAEAAAMPPKKPNRSYKR